MPFAGVPVILAREESCRHLIRRAADRHSGRRPEELPEGAEAIHLSQIPVLGMCWWVWLWRRLQLIGASPLSAGGGDPTRIFQTELRVSS